MVECYLKRRHFYLLDHKSDIDGEVNKKFSKISK